jgi:hypothetical protein
MVGSGAAIVDAGAAVAVATCSLPVPDPVELPVPHAASTSSTTTARALYSPVLLMLVFVTRLFCLLIMNDVPLLDA